MSMTKYLHPQSSVEDVQTWLIDYKFDEYVHNFIGYDGNKLLKEQRETIHMKLPGVEAIRLCALLNTFNHLSQYKERQSC